MEIKCVFPTIFLVAAISNISTQACKFERPKTLEDLRRPGISKRETLIKNDIKGPDFCREGEFMNLEAKKCEPCPDGQYMPVKSHSQIRCYQCSDATPGTAEVVVSQCTKTSNTFIGCREGFYLQPAAVDFNYDPKVVRCLPCTRCSKTVRPYEILPCSQFRDSLCCAGEDMLAFREDGQPDFICQQPLLRHAMFSDAGVKLGMKTGISGSTVERSQLKCNPGEYLETDEGGNPISCKECPDDTYMPDRDHTHTRCKECKIITKSQKDIKECVSKSEPLRVKTCRLNGTYLVVPRDKSLSRCEYCDVCPAQYYIGRACTNVSNTVCCPKPNMRVIDVGDKHECIEVTTLVTTENSHFTDDAASSKESTPSTIPPSTPNSGRASDASTTIRLEYILLIFFLILLVFFTIIIVCVYRVYCRNEQERDRNGGHELEMDDLLNDG